MKPDRVLLRAWLAIPLVGCLSTPSAPKDHDANDADANPDVADGAPADATVVPSIFNGRYILDPYFTAAGTCSEGTGVYSFRVTFDGAEYLMDLEHASTDHSATFDEETGHMTLRSEIDTTVSGHYFDEYTFDLQVSGTTVTGTGNYVLYENDVLTCMNPIEVNAGYIQP